MYPPISSRPESDPADETTLIDDVALSCGNYDQAHFIKEFHAFSGVNPSTYCARVGTHPTHILMPD